VIRAKGERRCEVNFLSGHRPLAAGELVGLGGSCAGA
jgi:hypothetical protein